MPKLALLIEYDGTNYCGWQRQLNSLSVQQVIESAVEMIIASKLSVVAAGRTDAGVHAKGQVAHISLIEPINIPTNKIPLALNSYLPLDIRILKAVITDDNFHSRYKAVAREYSYTLTTKYSVFTRHFISYIKYKLNEKRLFKCAELFLGKHEFLNFSKKNEETKNYLCNVEKCEWEKIENNIYKLTIRADRFVYGMVRSLVGAMIDVARGRRNFSDIIDALSNTESHIISPMAPANGLVLEKVYYPVQYQFFS